MVLSVVWPENLTLSYFLNLGLGSRLHLPDRVARESLQGLAWAWLSVREDEQVARAFGVSVSWYKCARRW